MAKRRKPKMELRYYKMPEGSPILALLGQKWIQNYGNDIDYLHFHNYLEIGFCYEGQGCLILGEDKVRFHDREFTVIPPNYPHTTNSDLGTISRWEYLFIDVEGFLDKFIDNSAKREKIVQRINSKALFLDAEENRSMAEKILKISLQTGAGANMRFADPIFSNYKRIMMDKVFQQSIVNTFLYLIIQVPIMLVLAILLAQLLNNKDLKFKGFFRTCVFLPCATSLVSYSLIFRSMFATDGLINSILIKLGILTTGYNFLGNSTSAKIVIIIALIWRWTGYNMVFYLAGLQNIEYSVYEAAKIDGANGWKTFWKITVPLLKPTIIMTFIMSINGTLQLFDESVNLTKGGPANTTITMSHYVYNTCFINVPNFGYAAAMSFIIFIMVAILAFINLKVGDTRD